MAGFTNKGKFRALEDFARSGDTVRLPLYTSAVAPSADTNTYADINSKRRLPAKLNRRFRLEAVLWISRKRSFNVRIQRY